MGEASAIDHSKADGDAEVDSSPDAGKPKASDTRAGRRGLTSRKRLALTIDAELTSETGQQNDSEPRDGQSSTSNAGNSGPDATALGDGDDAVPWWILEYRCPPPGHLGAHHVPVAAKDAEVPDAEQKASPISTNKDPPVSEEKQSEAKPLKQVFGRQVISKPKPEIASTEADRERSRSSAAEAARNRFHRQQSEPKAQDHARTRARAERAELHGGGKGAQALPRAQSNRVPSNWMWATSSVASTTDCATEESGQKPQQQLARVVTPSPSNLVRPLNKIDIHCQRSTAEPAAKKTPSRSENLRRPWKSKQSNERRTEQDPDRNKRKDQAASKHAKGNAALSAGNAQEAVECYTKAIELNPNDHVFFSNRSAAYLSMDDAEHALEDAEACIKVKGDWAKGYSRKGAALHALREYDDAIAAYQEGLAIEANNAACLNGIEEVKKAKQATPPFNPFANAFGPDMFGKIATNPRLSGFLSDPEFVAKLQEIQRDPSKINVHLTDPRVMTVLGELMGLNVNMPEDADEAAANQSYPVPPTSNSAAKEPARPKTPEPEPMDEDLTEEEIAEREAKKAAEAAKQRGNDFYKQKKFSEAIECYTEAIEKDPNNIAYVSNLAAVKLEMGEYDACIEDCKKAIEVGRANRADYALIAKVYVRIGNAYLKKGRDYVNLEAAINAYEGAQMENRTKEVERKIKNLQLELKKAKDLAYIDPEKALAAKNEGNEFFKGGDFPKAVERYTEAIKRDPKSAVYYANRAAAYTKLTSFMEAKRDCEKALEIDPKYVKAYSRLGAIQFFMKEFHKARESYEKGLALDANNQECMDGLRNVMYKIQSGETDEERAAHGLADPEIQNILRDPVMQNVLNDFQTDPVSAQRHLQNPGIMAKIEKLIAAGVLQTK